MPVSSLHSSSLCCEWYVGVGLRWGLRLDYKQTGEARQSLGAKVPRGGMGRQTTEMERTGQPQHPSSDSRAKSESEYILSIR